MKTLKNLWAGNVEDEDENEGSVIFYMMNLINMTSVVSIFNIL
jgi:hypothetical protein